MRRRLDADSISLRTWCCKAVTLDGQLRVKLRSSRRTSDLCGSIRRSSGNTSQLLRQTHRPGAVVRQLKATLLADVWHSARRAM